MQEIIQTENCAATLDFLLKRDRIQNPLLVCGRSVKETNIWKFLTENIKAKEFNDFTHDPDILSIDLGASSFEDNGCDCLISIGGGSAMDVAKGIKHTIGTDTLEHIAIPTTAGTGSESTQFAVLYDNGIKTSLDDPVLIPDVAILDHSFLRTLPDYQRRCTAIDALSQSIESWWSLRSNTESIDHSKRSISLFNMNVDAYLSNEYDGNKGMLLASNHSGRAINITRTTAPHALSYCISKKFNIPHGHAVSVTFVECWKLLLERMDETTHPLGKKWIGDTLTNISRSLGGSTMEDGPYIYEKLVERMDLKKPTTSLETISRMVGSINVDRISNFPLKLSKDDTKEIYSRSLQIS